MFLGDLQISSSLCFLQLDDTSESFCEFNYLLVQSLLPYLLLLNACDLWVVGVNVVLAIRSINLNIMMSRRYAIKTTYWILGMLVSTL